MVYDDFRFDPRRDIAPVDQFGFIDLKVALDSSSVPSQMPDSEQDYNGIEEPEMVLGKPRDIFEAIDSQKAFEAAAASASSGDDSEKDS